MKGLLKKDFQIIVSNWPVLLAICLCGCAIAVYIRIPDMLLCFVALLLSYQGVATIMNDQSSGWWPWAMSLPVRRKRIVYEKYIFCLLLGAIGTLLALVLYAIVSRLTGVEFSSESFQINMYILLIFIGLGLSSGILFCFYKKETAPLSMFIAVLIPLAVILAIIKLNNDPLDMFRTIGLCSMGAYFVIMALSPDIIYHWIDKN